MHNRLRLCRLARRKPTGTSTSVVSGQLLPGLQSISLTDLQRSSLASRPAANDEQMSVEQNIEAIRKGSDAFNRGDLEAGLDYLRPDIEWYMAFPLPDLPPDKTIYRGHDEVRVLWRAFRSAWASLTVTIEEVVDVRDDVVITRAHLVGVGGGGIEVDRTFFYVSEMVAGKLARIRPFDAKADALAAAGWQN